MVIMKIGREINAYVSAFVCAELFYPKVFFMGKVTNGDITKVAIALVVVVVPAVFR